MSFSFSDCGRERVNVFKKRTHSKLPLVPVSRLWQMATVEHMVLAVKQNLYLLAVCIFNQEYECWYNEAAALVFGLFRSAKQGQSDLQFTL